MKSVAAKDQEASLLRARRPRLARTPDPPHSQRARLSHRPIDSRAVPIPCEMARLRRCALLWGARARAS